MWEPRYQVYRMVEKWAGQQVAFQYLLAAGSSYASFFHNDCNRKMTHASWNMDNHTIVHNNSPNIPNNRNTQDHKNRDRTNMCIRNSSKTADASTNN